MTIESNIQNTGRVLGIDIGGTHIKSGIVTAIGNVSGFQSPATKDWINSGHFIDRLIEHIRTYEAQGISGCGIAIPGTIHAESNQALFVPAVPCLEGISLKDVLKEAFPQLIISVENDSNAASFGEYMLRNKKMSDGMFLITLGTGIGCGLIINGEMFKGGNGNALELGEILTEKKERLEDVIGVKGIGKMANAVQELYGLSVPEIIRSANSGNIQAVALMQSVGEILGKAIVHLIWLFDVRNIALGGGVSEAFVSIQAGVEKVFLESLPQNIRTGIRVEKATLGNNAGMVGIALRCFKEIKDKQE